MTDMAKDYMHDEQLIPDFLEQLKKARETDPLYRAVYQDKLIGCLAIADSLNDGYLIAYNSGMEHRRSRRDFCDDLVNSRTLLVVGNNTTSNRCQTVPTTISRARQLEPQYLGCDPMPLFESYHRVSFPEVTLFVYPEHFLVEIQTREVVDRIVKREDIKTAIIITTSSILLTDMVNTAVLVIQSRV